MYLMVSSEMLTQNIKTLKSRNNRQTDLDNKNIHINKDQKIFWGDVVFTRLGSLVKPLKFMTIKTRLPEMKHSEKEKKILSIFRYSDCSPPNTAEAFTED